VGKSCVVEPESRLSVEDFDATAGRSGLGGDVPALPGLTRGGALPGSTHGSESKSEGELPSWTNRDHRLRCRNESPAVVSGCDYLMELICRRRP
jgi:hypothetical protein